MSRGLEEFNAAIAATNMIVPNKDIPIQNYDRVSCRIIKFGKLNEIKWKGKDGKPDNVTQHIRIYLHVYSWFSAESQQNRTDIANKVVTINPRVAWLPELVALQRGLEEQYGDKEELFRHKIQILRKDRKLPQGDGKYGYMEVVDDGVDSSFRDNEHESVADVDDAPRETDRIETVKTPTFKDRLFACKTVEEAYKVMKSEYDSISDPEKQSEIGKEYKSAKDRIVCSLIVASGDSGQYVDTAKALIAKYYAKEPNKHAEILEYAHQVASTQVAAGDEDLPF